MGETYLGDVRAMSFDFVPRGWAACDGQLLPIGQHQALYSLLGSRFGGDGKTSFGLPALAGVPTQDGRALAYCICLQGQFPVH